MKVLEENPTTLAGMAAGAIAVIMQFVPYWGPEADKLITLVAAGVVAWKIVPKFWVGVRFVHWIVAIGVILSGISFSSKAVHQAEMHMLEAEQAHVECIPRSTYAMIGAPRWLWYQGQEKTVPEDTSTQPKPKKPMTRQIW